MTYQYVGPIYYSKISWELSHHSIFAPKGSFYRAAIPRDVIEGAPTPSEWGLPSAILHNSMCKITDFFRSHKIIFGVCVGFYPQHVI